jgi:hypothetical protein
MVSVTRLARSPKAGNPLSQGIRSVGGQSVMLPGEQADRRPIGNVWRAIGPRTE